MTMNEAAGRFRTSLLTLGAAAVALFPLSGCVGEATSAAVVTTANATPATVTAGGDLPDVLARIGDEEITMADVRERIGDDLDQLDMMYLQRRHEAVKSTVDAILRQRVVLATAQLEGTTVEGLAEQEAGGTLDPSEIEIAAWYESNRDRTAGRTLDDIRDQIAELLLKERREAAMANLEKRLYEERQVAVFLEPFRVELDNSGAPSSGPEDAPITFVEFSDFECPYCARFFPTLKRLQAEYGDRIRIVYRQYPITNIHPNAFKAAEASLCAADQDRFWEYHDLLFEEQSRIAVSDLKEKAGRLGLDRAEFETCLDSGRYVEQVQNDLKEGRRAGVNGTPALFVNGVRVPGGAVSFDVVARAIAEEEARLQR